MRQFLVLVTLAAGFSPAGAPAESAGRVEIPLRLHGGKMIVPVEASDGERLEFVVGTGSNVTVLSEHGAARLAAAAELALGGVPVPLEQARTLADADFTVAGETFDGLVASNTLNRFDVLFDAPGKRLVLQKIGRSVTWDGTALGPPVPLRVYHGTILALDVEVNGKEYPAMLDLGAASVIVNQRLADEAQVEGGRATLDVGASSYPDLEVEVLDLPIFERFAPGGGFVLVGAPIAVDCAVSISYVHQELRTCTR